MVRDRCEPHPCNRLRDTLREIYFILMTFLISYIVFLATEPEFYEYNSPLMLLGCAYGHCPPNALRAAWIAGTALLTPLIALLLWHGYSSRVLEDLGDEDRKGPWTLVKEVYREMVLVSMPLALLIVGAPPTFTLRELGAVRMIHYLRAAAIAYLAAVSVAALRWFHILRLPSARRQ